MLITIIVISAVAVVCLGLAIWFWFELEKVKTDRNKFEGQLKTAEKDKNDALWQLYLSEVSLLTSVSALYNERRRFVDLKKISDETLGSYRKFRKNVETKAEKRLVRKSAAVAMSFIPGLGLLDILGDIGEILADAGDASEFIDNMPNEIKKLAKIPSELPFDESMINDDTPFDLIENSHKTFQESFKNEFIEFDESDGQMNVDASELKTFVDDTIQSTQDLEPVKSITEEERQKIIDRTLDRVHKFAESAG